MKFKHGCLPVAVLWTACLRCSPGGIALAAALLSSPAMAGERHIQVQWRELAPAAAGRTVSLVLPDGALLEGVMAEVRDDSLILQVRKSSDGRYPQGQPASLPRAQVRVVQIEETRGPWRATGAAIAGAGGVIGGWALAEGVLHTSGEGQGIWREPRGVLSVLGFGAGGALAGYVLGCRLDRRVTFLHVAP